VLHLYIEIPLSSHTEQRAPPLEQQVVSVENK